jgi:hypothetical protein
MMLTPLLAAIGLGAVCVHAQHASPANEARRLLQQQTYRDKAWGAWYAGTSHDPGLRETLLARLRSAQPLRDAQRDTAEYAYVQALFDALIQIPGVIPNEVIVPFEGSWRAEILILMSRRPVESDLLTMRGHSLSDAESDAVDGLLYQVSGPDFFQRTLEDLRITHLFVVTDQATAYGGEAGGCGTGTRRFPAGFPPITLYQLWADLTQTRTGDSLLMQQPVAVYYRRVVAPTDGAAEWTECTYSSRVTNEVRQRRLAMFFSAIGRLTAVQSEKTFSPRTTIEWHGAAEAASEMERALAEQSASIQALVAEAQRGGLLHASGMRLSIRTVVQDLRRKMNGPVPGIAPHEIVIP